MNKNRNQNTSQQIPDSYQYQGYSKIMKQPVNPNSTSFSFGSQNQDIRIKNMPGYMIKCALTIFFGCLMAYASATVVKNIFPSSGPFDWSNIPHILVTLDVYGVILLIILFTYSKKFLSDNLESSETNEINKSFILKVFLSVVFIIVMYLLFPFFVSFVTRNEADLFLLIPLSVAIVATLIFIVLKNEPLNTVTIISSIKFTYKSLFVLTILYMLFTSRAMISILPLQFLIFSFMILIFFVASLPIMIVSFVALKQSYLKDLSESD